MGISEVLRDIRSGLDGADVGFRWDSVTVNVEIRESDPLIDRETKYAFETVVVSEHVEQGAGASLEPADLANESSSPSRPVRTFQSDIEEILEKHLAPIKESLKPKYESVKSFADRKVKSSKKS